MKTNCEDCGGEIYYDDVHGYWAHVPVNGSIPRHIPRVPKWAEKNKSEDDTLLFQYDTVQDGYVIYYKGSKITGYKVAHLLNEIASNFNEIIDAKLE